MSDKKSSDFFLLRLFIARLGFLSFYEKKTLEAMFSCVSELIVLSLEELSLYVGRTLKTTLWNPILLHELSFRDLKLISMYNVQVLFYDDEDYPYRLREIYDPAYAIFCRGNVKVLNRPIVSIVGTRKPSIDGAKATKKIAQNLSIAGLSIASGLAFGIDSQAHMGCLCAQGSKNCGQTIAVLGSGVDNITPASNKRLAQAILASGGCIISEYPFGSEVQLWHFVQRNRIISALSLVTLVMEAPRGSGSLITADFALEQGRELCFFCESDSLAHDIDFVQTNDSKKVKKRSVSDYVAEGARLVFDEMDIISLILS